MKFIVWSDLHCEINKALMGMAPVEGDVLVLAGDIFNAQAFKRHPTSNVFPDWQRQFAASLVSEVFPLFKKVIYVLGNHEHYHGIITSSHGIMRDWFDHYGATNLHILENEWVVVDDVVIYGATLWTNLATAAWQDAVERGMNDYHCIHLPSPLDGLALQKDVPLTFHETITGAYTHKLHMESLEKLKRFLAQMREDPELSGKKLVVVTHHPPSMRSIHTSHTGDRLNPGFASDLDDFIRENPEIKVWVHGHTHMSFDYDIGKTRVFANQHGYYHEAQTALFKVDGGFEV